MPPVVDILCYELLASIDPFAWCLRSQLGLRITTKRLFAEFTTATGLDASPACGHIAGRVGSAAPAEADHVTWERSVVWLSADIIIHNDTSNTFSECSVLMKTNQAFIALR